MSLAREDDFSVLSYAGLVFFAKAVPDCIGEAFACFDVPAELGLGSRFVYLLSAWA